MTKTNDALWQNAFEVMRSNYSLTDDAIGVFAVNLQFALDDIQPLQVKRSLAAEMIKNVTLFM